jgi:hypothetical protein
MNIRNLINKSAEDTEKLLLQKKYFNAYMKYDRNFQLEISEKYFEIYDNEGKEVLVFATDDILKILKEKRII